MSECSDVKKVKKKWPEEALIHNPHCEKNWKLTVANTGESFDVCGSPAMHHSIILESQKLGSMILYNFVFPSPKKRKYCQNITKHFFKNLFHICWEILCLVNALHCNEFIAESANMLQPSSPIFYSARTMAYPLLFFLCVLLYFC